MKLFCIILLSFFCFGLSAQGNKKIIAACFDGAEYYLPDSTLKCVYKMKKGIRQGYGIDFSRSGEAISIGKYKNGLREGRWLNRDGFTDWYEKGETNEGSMPGCGTGVFKAKEDFKALYLKLVNSEKHGKRKSRNKSVSQ